MAAYPPGTADVCHIESESEPDKRYEMIRTRSGWHHADATCPAFAEGTGKECRHVNELNSEEHDERGALVIVPAGGDPLAIVDELESTAIIEALAGKVSDAWVYSFKQKGQQIVGLSAVGVDQAARYMASKGEALRIIDCHIEYEDEREARFFAVAGRYAVNGEGRSILLDTCTGAKRQPKWGKRADGNGEYAIEAWYEIGTTKACRNARENLLNDEVRQHIIREATAAAANGGGAVRRVVERDDREREAAPATNGIGEQRARVRRALEDRFGRHAEPRAEWEAEHMPEGIGQLTKERCEEMLAVLIQEASAAG